MSDSCCRLCTRLYPLTENFPKPLLDVRGKKILEWLIEDLGDLEYVVVTNHRFAPIFREWADTRAEKITVVDDGTSTNETRLGAVCDMQFAIRQAGRCILCIFLPAVIPSNNQMLSA